MDEKIKLLKDYKDCMDKLNNLDKYNYVDSKLWALHTYSDWVKEENIDCLSVGTILPKTDREAAYNSLSNLKSILEKIAIKKGL